MNATPDFVLFRVNCASAYALTRTTCMALSRRQSIFAGACTNLYGTPFLSVSRQEHLCIAVCSSPGICEIETAPQSIEATFTGKNETFQYTKVRSIYLLPGSCSYQRIIDSILRVRSSILAVDRLLTFIGAVAKRLKCIKPIAPGATEHRGPHNHSLDKKVVHFCEDRYSCPTLSSHCCSLTITY
jgi:hypothetical protein